MQHADRAALIAANAPKEERKQQESKKGLLSRAADKLGGLFRRNKSGAARELRATEQATTSSAAKL